MKIVNLNTKKQNVFTSVNFKNTQMTKWEKKRRSTVLYVKSKIVNNYTELLTLSHNHALFNNKIRRTPVRHRKLD